jgi:chromatin remodeling complex protein RSC6
MVRTVKTPVSNANILPTDKTVKTKKPKVEKPVVEAPAVVSVTEVSTEPVVEGSLQAKLAEYGAKLQSLVSLVNVAKNDYKTLEKIVNRELKAAQKASSKRKKSSGNRAPSGFVKPTLITDELAAFLGKDKGSLLARTAVSKEINAYIRANNLQDPANGRKINADAKLAKLLKLAKTDELTYFNLQKYMKHHFIKMTPSLPVSNA